MRTSAPRSRRIRTHSDRFFHAALCNAVCLLKSYCRPRPYFTSVPLSLAALLALVWLLKAPIRPSAEKLSLSGTLPTAST